MREGEHFIETHTKEEGVKMAVHNLAANRPRTRIGRLWHRLRGKDTNAVLGERK